MFQFIGFPACTLFDSCTAVMTPSWRVSPFGNPWIYRLFAAPHGLSQLATSFFGVWCQGIRPVLFIAWSLFSLVNISRSYRFRFEIASYVVMTLPLALNLQNILYSLLWYMQFSMNTWEKISQNYTVQKKKAISQGQYRPWVPRSAETVRLSP